jgi:branched-chain amino acid transport system permease protein
LAQVGFALESALVVSAAELTVMSQGIKPGIGAHIMLISLAATIVGGIGSLKGADGRQVQEATSLGLATRLSGPSQ